MSIISKKNGDSYLYFKTTSAQKFSVIDSASNELYELPSVAPTENGQVIAVNVDGSSSFVNNTAVNALIADQPLVIPETGAVIISDGLTGTGTNFTNAIKFNEDIVSINAQLDCYLSANFNDSINIQKESNPVSMFMDDDKNFNINNQQLSSTKFIGSSSYNFDNNIISSQNVILNQGKSLTLNNDTDANNVKLYKQNGLNGTFFIDNQSGTKTTFKGANGYFMDNGLSIGDNTTTKKILLNNVEIKPPVQFLNNYYVSPNGSNASGTGSISNPWGTISYAMGIINALPAETNIIINLSAGTYTENVSITKSGVSLVGLNPIACVINGDITFNMVQNSSFYAVGVLERVQINGTLTHTNNTIYNNTLSISGIISASPSGKNNLVCQTFGGGFLGDATIRDSVFYANNDTTAVLVNNSALFMVGSQIQNSPVLGTTIQNYVFVSGAGRFNAFGCSMYNASTSASVKALIEVSNTSNATSSTTINNCILMFTAPASTTTGAIMNFSNTASANTVNFYNNYCKANVSVGSPTNYLVLKTSSNVGSNVNFTFGGNLGSTTGHHIPPSGYVIGWTKTAMNAVV